MYVGLKDNSFCPPLMFSIKHLFGTLCSYLSYYFLRKEEIRQFGAGKTYEAK